jgi:1-aminocyclopropane-1-carboxylate deaminase
MNTDSTVAAARTCGTDAFPRFELLHGRSTIHRLPRLTAHLGGPEIWAKREDCNSGVGLGGNKLRKLEFLVADALAQGCDTLVSIGGVQSNHTRQVAAAAAVAGLRARLVQESWVPWPDAVYDRVGNILLSRIMGAEVELVEADFDIGVKPSWERAVQEIRAAGGKPYAIPAGASDHELGGLGFARFAEEVAAQEEELGVFFDTIVTCTVTGSTQAGMIAGFAAQERPRRVIGVDASIRIGETRAAVERIAKSTAAKIGLPREITAADVEVVDGYAHPRYGIPNDETIAAIRLSGRLEGMIIDPVYEGKSMHGMIDLIRLGEIAPDSNVLYVHLGGVPALNGYSALFRR